MAERGIKIQGSCAAPASFKDRSLNRLEPSELSATCGGGGGDGDSSAPPSTDPATTPGAPAALEIRPATNQIVFEGDPLKLTCRMADNSSQLAPPSWSHRRMDGSVTAPEDLNAQVTTAKLTGAVESTLQLQRLEQKHAGTWLCADGLLRPAGVSRSVEVTVLSLSTPTCPSQVTQSNKGRYAWPRTMAGLRIHLPCQASSSTNSGGGQASQQASRSCDAGGSWSDPPDVASCPYLSEVTKVLEQFARTNLTFSKTSALESARRFKSYLADADPLQDPQDAWFAAETLEHYLDASGRHTELLPVVMDVLALLVRQPVELLADCRHRLLSMLQQAPLKTPAPFQYEAGTLVMYSTVHRRRLWALSASKWFQCRGSNEVVFLSTLYPKNPYRPSRRCCDLRRNPRYLGHPYFQVGKFLF